LLVNEAGLLWSPLWEGLFIWCMDNFPKRYYDVKWYDRAAFILDLARVPNAGKVLSKRELKLGFNSMLDYTPVDCRQIHHSAAKKPFVKLLPKHNGDLWCYLGRTFGQLAGMSEMTACARDGDWLKCAAKFARTGQMLASVKDSMRFPQGANLDTVSTAPLVNVWEANYCHVMGWYLPAFKHADQLENFTAMNEVSNQICERLKETVKDYKELSVESYLTTDHWFDVPKEASERHAAFKCAMGGPGGCAFDMVSCVYSFCMLKDGRMGQGLQCREIQEELLPPTARWLTDESLKAHSIEDFYNTKYHNEKKAPSKSMAFM
jgi:hypothetical protein